MFPAFGRLNAMLNFEDGLAQVLEVGGGHHSTFEYFEGARTAQNVTVSDELPPGAKVTWSGV